MRGRRTVDKGRVRLKDRLLVSAGLWLLIGAGYGLYRLALWIVGLFG